MQEKLKSYGNTTDMTWVAGAQYNYNFDRCLFMPATLTAGAEYNQDRLKDNMWGRGRYLDQRVNTVSAFAQNEWKTARWSFLVGARMDKHSRYSVRVPMCVSTPRIISTCVPATRSASEHHRLSTKTCTLTTWAERYR